ncbi:hypothetical protein SAMN05444279_12619 [Ruegeria intermedia]|uniref:Uncharacterized protein n=1 Tax=Ruegeria intermedia TaxID=996115 RepID=A0A1M5AJ12_9RHOB|nr:hypothetical protein [Ruegeria intermedia]SHF30116.1 hypothetical protein SAMN05444279_12619 [Ruegeria intermedia]
MTAHDFSAEIARLERQLREANLETRLALQPSVSKVIDRMRAEGVPVPTRLRLLDAALVEDALEAKFDNLPI